MLTVGKTVNFHKNVWRISRRALILLSWRFFLRCKWHTRLPSYKVLIVLQFLSIIWQHFELSPPIHLSLKLYHNWVSPFSTWIKILNLDFSHDNFTSLLVDPDTLKPLSKYQSWSSNSRTLSRTRPCETLILIFQESYLTRDSANLSLPYR